MTILIVDDSKDFRIIMSALVRSDTALGAVLEAQDGMEALELVLRERPRIVVMDVMMPRLDGFQATRLIKEEWPETRVIVVSSERDDSYESQAFTHGADAFIDKSDITSALLPAIRRLLER